VHVAENDNWRQIVRRAWTDPVFKERLFKDTENVLREYNISIPKGVTYEVVEDQLVGKRYLVLPPFTDEAELQVDDFGRDINSGDPGF
jgi:hypothetical protein